MRHKKKLFEFFDISPREPSRKTSQQEKKLTWMKKNLKTQFQQYSAQPKNLPNMKKSYGF